MVRTFLPAPDGFDAQSYAKAASGAVGLQLPEEDVAEVATNLARTAGFATLLEDADEIPPAPVFRPEVAR